MKKSMGLTGEAFNHKLAASFDSEADARAAADRLVEVAGLGRDQVTVVMPDDTNIEQELEPESRGIWHTLIRAHLWLGLAGAVVGAIVYFLLAAAGLPFVVQNPGWASGMIVVLFFVAGLLLGGLVTVRPDHAPYIRASASALSRGKSLVTVHAREMEELERARAELEKHDAKIISTL